MCLERRSGRIGVEGRREGRLRSGSRGGGARARVGVGRAIA